MKGSHLHEFNHSPQLRCPMSEFRIEQYPINGGFIHAFKNLFNRPFTLTCLLFVRYWRSFSACAVLTWNFRKSAPKSWKGDYVYETKSTPIVHIWKVRLHDENTATYFRTKGTLRRRNSLTCSWRLIAGSQRTGAFSHTTLKTESDKKIFAYSHGAVDNQSFLLHIVRVLHWLSLDCKHDLQAQEKGYIFIGYRSHARLCHAQENIWCWLIFSYPANKFFLHL